jgi:hypothetical protein
MSNTEHQSSLREAGFTKVVVVFIGENGDLAIRADIIPVTAMPGVTEFFNTIRIG